MGYRPLWPDDEPLRPAGAEALGAGEAEGAGRDCVGCGRGVADTAGGEYERAGGGE